MDETAQYKKQIDKIGSVLTVVAPFLSSLLRKARIILVDDPKIPLAGTDADHNIVLNSTFFKELSFEEQTFILAHEVLHMALNHVHRGKNRNMLIWNLSTDAVVNDILSQMINPPDRIKISMVTHDKIYRMLRGSRVFVPDGFDKYGAEEIYKLLKQFYENNSNIRSSIEATKENGTWIGDLKNNKYEGKVIREGDSEIYNSKDIKERAEKWKEEVFKAYTIQKTAGNVPAGLKLIVNKLFKPKIDWRQQLRSAFKEGLGRTIVSSWTRINRKLSYNAPGIKRYTIPTVWVLIDTSGSISSTELEKFLSEVYAIAGMTDIKVICWDTRAYDIIHARNKNEVYLKIIENLYGGGGTEIAPALRKTFNKMKPMDIVVVFSDGYIWDIDEFETKKLFEMVAVKSSKAIFVTTEKEPNIPRWTIIKLDN